MTYSKEMIKQINEEYLAFANLKIQEKNLDYLLTLSDIEVAFIKTFTISLIVTITDDSIQFVTRGLNMKILRASINLEKGCFLIGERGLFHPSNGRANQIFYQFLVESGTISKILSLKNEIEK